MNFNRGVYLSLQETRKFVQVGVSSRVNYLKRDTIEPKCVFKVGGDLD